MDLKNINKNKAKDENDENSDVNSFKDGSNGGTGHRKPRQNHNDWPGLFFYKILSSIDKKRIRELCEEHGTIVNINFLKERRACYVDCASLADRKAIKEALSKHTDFQVTFTKKSSVQGDGKDERYNRNKKNSYTSDSNNNSKNNNNDYNDDDDYDDDWNPLASNDNDKSSDESRSKMDGPKDKQAYNKTFVDKKNTNPPYLYITNVPKGVTKHVMENLCKPHGKVTDIRLNPVQRRCFIDCLTEADAESIKRGLCDNEFGFVVYMGRTRKQDYDNEPPKQETPFEDRRPSNTAEKKGPWRGNRLPEKLEESFDKFFINEKEIEDKPHFEFIGKCVVCSMKCFLTCARCATFYCGYKCQADDWKHHRSSCGQNTLQAEDEHEEAATGTADEKSKSSHSSQHFKERNYNEDEHKSQNSKPNRNIPKENNGLQNRQEEKATRSKEILPVSEGKKVFVKGCPLSGTTVMITSIVKTNLVFLRSYDDEANLNYLEILTAVENCSKSLKHFPDDKRPQIGEIVLTKFEGKLNRALVLGINSDQKYRVNYIDYGGIDDKNLKELYKATEDIMRLSILTKPVFLKDVPDTFLTYELRSFMYSYLENIPLRIEYAPEDFIKKKGIFAVKLSDVKNNCIFNNAVARLCKPPEDDTEDVLFETDLEKVDLPIGNNIELLVMDNSMLNVGLIACTTQQSAYEIQKLQKVCNDYIKSLEKETPYAPRVGELCLAQYDVDKNWYRGSCCELAGDGFPTILFLDYGNLAMVNIKNIRPYPRSFDFPIFTRECIIKGFPTSCDSALVKRAEELIPCCMPLRCDNVTKTPVHKLTLNSIVQRLVDEGLLNPKDNDNDTDADE